MSMISLYGNLTQTPTLKKTKDGKEYMLLRLAENIRKKENGEYVKDDNGHYINQATYYHSIFVFDHGLCFLAQQLDMGAPLFVKGMANLSKQKDNNNYEVLRLDSINATFIDIDQFSKEEEQLNESA